MGLNEQEAKEKGIAHAVTVYGIDDLDRAIADSEAHGFVKVITPPGTDKILGATIVGEHAGDLLAEFVLGDAPRHRPEQGPRHDPHLSHARRGQQVRRRRLEARHRDARADGLPRGLPGLAPRRGAGSARCSALGAALLRRQRPATATIDKRSTDDDDPRPLLPPPLALQRARRRVRPHPRRLGRAAEEAREGDRRRQGLAGALRRFREGPRGAQGLPRGGLEGDAGRVRRLAEGRAAWPSSSTPTTRTRSS